MARSGTGRPQKPGVGFVGCCLPRQCGIATFTYDLVEAIADQSDGDQSHVIAAMNDQPGGYDYPDCVGFQIDVDDPGDYTLAAEYLNEYCSVVNLQHEFGIFGLPWGENVLHLIRRLRRPLVVTCHTVPIDPEPAQREVLTEIVSRADRLIVMNPRAIDFLQALYGARYDQIACVRHGIHDMPFRNPPIEKKKLGLRGPVLLTFGLLSRPKGLEYMVDAMAGVVREWPDATYVIMGATHPHVVKQEGEVYRRSLMARVRQHGLEDNVKFIDCFADLSDLIGYLYETDIFVAPYLSLGQMTSGALSYAAGAGKAVVATPFLHARELLADGRGRLVPARSVPALSRNVIDLLTDKTATDQMRRRVYQYTRGMVWPAVAREYIRVFESVLRRPPRAVPLVSPMATSKQRPTVAGGQPK